MTFLTWVVAANSDPRSLSFPTALEGYRLLGKGKNAASLKQIGAALSFAYRHWDLKNAFAKIDPKLLNEPEIRYLLLAEIRRFLDTSKPGSRAPLLGDKYAYMTIYSVERWDTWTRI